MSLKIEVEWRDDGYTRSLIEGEGGSKDLRRVAESLLSQADFMDGIGRDDEDDGFSIDPIPPHVMKRAAYMADTKMRRVLWACRELAAPVAANTNRWFIVAEERMRKLALLYPKIVEALDGKAPGRRVCGEHEDGA